LQKIKDGDSVSFRRSETGKIDGPFGREG